MYRSIVYLPPYTALTRHQSIKSQPRVTDTSERVYERVYVLVAVRGGERDANAARA